MDKCKPNLILGVITQKKKSRVRITEKQMYCQLHKLFLVLLEQSVPTLCDFTNISKCRSLAKTTNRHREASFSELHKILLCFQGCLCCGKLNSIFLNGLTLTCRYYVIHLRHLAALQKWSDRFTYDICLFQYFSIVSSNYQFQHRPIGFSKQEQLSTQ